MKKIIGIFILCIMFLLLVTLVVTAKTADEWNNEGAGLLIEGKYEEALKAFDRTLEIDQQNTMAWNNKGFTLYLLERHEEAIGCCDKALEIDPQDVGAWNNKGLALYGLGRYEEAIECFNKALDTDPQCTAAQNNKEAALNELGRTEEVKSTLSVVTASSESDTLKKGDIVYRKGALIFEHCGIYIGKNEEGIDTVIEVMNKDYVPPNGGAREISLEDFKNTKGRKYLGAKTVPKLDENKRNEIVEFVKKVLDETKEKKIQYKLVISNQEVGVVKDGKKLYSCVSFVEEAYASVGIDLVTADCTLTPKWQRKSPKLIDVKSELPEDKDLADTDEKEEQEDKDLGDTDEEEEQEDKDLGGIDFSSIQLNYISVSSDQNGGTFSYVLKAQKAEEGDNIIDIKDATELSLNAFFIGLTLPDSKFWVNLNPWEPDVIMDEDLRNTDVGRIMLEADFQMKRDLCRYENPCESKIGEEFWWLLEKKSEELIKECMKKHPNEIEDADNVLFSAAMVFWIVPDKTEVYGTDDEVYIVNITLNIESKGEYEYSAYHIVNQNPVVSDDCKEDLNEAADKFGRYWMELEEEMMLPLVVQEVNYGKNYSDLRQVYTSLALAQWYKDNYWYNKYLYTSGLFTDRIDTKDLTGLESKYRWSAEGIWSDYARSFEEGEYHCWKNRTYEERGYIITESIPYSQGGVAFMAIKLINIGSSMPSDLKELTSEAVNATFVNEGDYYYFGDRMYMQPTTTTLRPLGFGVIFAIAGLLAVAYLLRRRK
jgi:PGF-CTERM protein